MHKALCVYMHIPKYKLYKPYNIALMYVFRTDHLALINNLVCSSMWMATSLIPGFALLLVFLC